MNKRSLAFTLLLVVLAVTQFLTVSAANTTYTTTTKAPFPQSVVNYMGTRTMRYHHFVWHNIRNLWNKLNSTTQAKIAKLGWKPPRPALRYDSEGYSYAIENNTSGEDFLYMHRQMIAQANAVITKNKDPFGNVTGWNSIPSPTSKSYPIPANYTIPNNSVLTDQIKLWKGDYIYNRMLQVEKTMTDPVQLRNMTLGEMGARIEFTLHNWAHMRFSNVSSVGYRSKTSNPVPNVDTKWDNLAYNWLGDNYGSHINPMFWKIHGWVDNRIEDWRKANNLTTIPWKSTWVGGNWTKLPELIAANSNSRILNQASGDVTGTEDMNMDDMEMSSLDVLEELVQILSECGEESHFYDPIVSTDVHHDDEVIVRLRKVTKKTVTKSFRASSNSNSNNN